VDVVYGCECDVVYGYVMNYIMFGYVMEYIEYGCECGFKFPGFKFLVVHLVIPISIKKLVSRLIYNGWGWALIDKHVLSTRASPNRGR
jgi:hypothetical protein